MKPHEQAFEYDPDGDVVTTREDGVRVAVAREVSDDDGPLIAAAPEMARVLLAVEWVSEGNDVWCPYCLGRRAFDMPETGHKPTCSRQLVLRKAGVLT